MPIQKQADPSINDRFDGLHTIKKEIILNADSSHTAAASPFAVNNVRLFIAFRVFFNCRFYLSGVYRAVSRFRTQRGPIFPF